MFSPDDDDGLSKWDKEPEYVKANNLSVAYTPGGRRVMIPMAYGFNIFPTIGRLVSEVARGHKTADQATVDWMVAAADAFNPLGGAQGLAQIASPTVLDPFLETGLLNKNFAGNPIMPEKYGQTRADSTLKFRSVSTPAAWFAPWLNRVTGGDEVIGGYIDVSPESVDHFWDFATGGVGKMAARISNLVTDPTGTRFPNDVPLLRRFYADLPGWSAQQVFYAYAEEAETRAKQIESAREGGHTEAVKRLRSRYGRIASLSKQASQMRRQISKLRDKPNGDARIEKIMQAFTRRARVAWGAAGRGTLPRPGLIGSR